MQKLKLSEARVGQQVQIDSIEADEHTQLKLLSLGILPGDILEVTGRAIFRGPISLKHSSGTFLALRRFQAGQIQVTLLKG